MLVQRITRILVQRITPSTTNYADKRI